METFPLNERKERTAGFLKKEKMGSALTCPQMKALDCPLVLTRGRLPKTENLSVSTSAYNYRKSHNKRTDSV